MGCSYSFLSLEPDQFIPNTKQFQAKLQEAQSLIAKGNYKEVQKIADDLFMRNKLEYASAIYRLIIKNNPKLDYPFQGLGNLQLAYGLYLWNIPKWYLQRSKLSNKKNPYDALSLCNCQMKAYEKTKFCQQSINWYRQQLQRKKDPRLMFGLANLLAETSKSQAIQLYTRAIALLPNKIYLLLSLAFTYYSTGNKPKAIQYSEMAAKIQPQNGYSELVLVLTEDDIDTRIQKLCNIRNKNIRQRCMKQIAILYSQQKNNPQQALNYLDESVSLLKKKGFEDFQLNIREIGLYLSLQQYRVYIQLAAEQIANNYTTNNPIRNQCKDFLIDNFIDILSKNKLSTKEILTNIAYMSSTKHDLFTRYIFFAKLFFQRKVFSFAFECMKESAKNISLTTQIQLVMGTYRDLIAQYKLTNSELTPFLPIIHSELFDLASISRQSSKEGWKKGIQCYLLAIKVKPDCAKSHYSIGQFYRMDHCYQQALDYFEKTLQIDPNFTLAQAQKAFCYLYTGDRQLGMNSFHKITDQLSKGNNNLDDYQRQCLMLLAGQFSRQYQELSTKKSTQVSKLSASESQIFKEK